MKTLFILSLCVWLEKGLCADSGLAAGSCTASEASCSAVGGNSLLQVQRASKQLVMGTSLMDDYASAGIQEPEPEAEPYGEAGGGPFAGSGAIKPPFKIPFSTAKYTTGSYTVKSDDGTTGAVVFWKEGGDKLSLGLAGNAEWVAFGMNPFGPGQMGADIVICRQMDHALHKFEAHDYSCDSWSGAPQLDKEQDWITTAGGQSDDGVTWCEMSRPLRTCEYKEDMQIDFHDMAFYGFLAWAPADTAPCSLAWSKAINFQTFPLSFASSSAASQALPADAHTVSILAPAHTVAPAGSLICTYHKLPLKDENTNYHMVAFKLKQSGAAKDAGVQHHVTLHGCSKPLPGVAENAEIPCYGEAMADCPITLAPLSSNTLAAGDTGVPVGGSGPRHAVFVRHFYNPQGKKNVVDTGSQFDLTLTSTLRPKVVGAMGMSTDMIDVPPKTYGHVVTAVCPASCTQFIKGEVNVTSVQIHMHASGKRGRLRIVRNGVELEELVDMNPFDTDVQIKQIKRTILPEDTLILECTYDNDGDVPVVHGPNIDDEMCTAALTTEGAAVVPLCAVEPGGKTFCGGTNTYGVTEFLPITPDFVPYSSMKKTCHGTKVATPASAGSCSSTGEVITGHISCDMPGSDFKVTWSADCEAEVVTFSLTAKSWSNPPTTALGIALYDAGSATESIDAPATFNAGDIRQAVNPSYSKGYVTMSLTVPMGAQLKPDKFVHMVCYINQISTDLSSATAQKKLLSPRISLFGGVAESYHYHGSPEWIKAPAPPPPAPTPVPKGLCPQGWSMNYGKCWHVSELSGNWFDGKYDCQLKGAVLAKISSSAENQFVTNLASKDGKVWIGASEVGRTEGDYGWTDGTGIEFANWITPDATKGTKWVDAVMIDYMTKWGTQKWWTMPAFTQARWACMSPPSATCADIMHPFLAGKGATCATMNPSKVCKRCKKSLNWKENKYCQFTCWKLGCGYASDDCSAPTPTPAPTPASMQCTDTMHPFLAGKGVTCAALKVGKLCKRCKNNPVWKSNKYCQFTCWKKGCGYGGDDCSSTPTSAPPKCTDTPHPFMKKKGKACATFGAVKKCKRCNKNPVWKKNKYCQLSCWKMGCGYDGDDCSEASVA